MPTLHYVFDPLCGWCYAAAPLVDAARDLPGLRVQFHGGGMMTGANRRAITPQWRDYVMPHDRRIAALTGQPFGDAYFDGLLRDTDAVMDSAPPTTAVLAAEALAGRGLDMAHRVQRAHYAQGRRIADVAVLQSLAADLGLDATAFADAYERLAGAPTQAHIADSRQWLARAGGQGFPTFALQREGGALVPLDIGPWLGRPAPWRAHLQGLLAQAQPTVAAATSAMACGPDACDI
ncbi:DsbA family protein [Pseudorhodoferax sp. Leaf267]|uniref:DsbA family protein n=1 Tax=Pseudorhodoferax sp. Leaf267 TaxID=1736316 RepID=UPI0006FF33EC|nr:DsbA family protein [Pseudorhodoferax sp. Leaf267]KQP14397.1 protein-disulfide isomerase [Pseudorhodoferax sp. Leaf267]